FKNRQSRSQRLDKKQEVKNVVEQPTKCGTQEFKVYSNPLFADEEINSDKLDPHCFNAESDFVESLSNRDTLIDSSLKFDYLEEFSCALIPTSIADEERIRREYAEYISIIERLFTINPCPQLLDDSIPIPKNESSNFDHQDDPLFPRPLPKPPDVEFDFEPNSEEVISTVMNNIEELNEDECFDPGDLVIVLEFAYYCLI
nr:hypothetical protein [Tanacetum cinerariifolium]